jgi:hypothetical protein
MIFHKHINKLLNNLKSIFIKIYLNINLLAILKKKEDNISSIFQKWKKKLLISSIKKQSILKINKFLDSKIYKQFIEY